MNRIKRIIVTWLSVAMIINSMPLPVFANEADMAHMPELTEFSEILGVEENTSEGELLAETPAAEETELEAASANEGGSVGAEYINGDLAQGSETVIALQVDDETVETTDEVTGTGTENDPWVVSTWAELKDKMTSSGHIKLNDNIRPEDPANSGCLEVPTSTVVTLDLNGKTIDRGLTEMEAVENGNVIIVSGNLTLKDGIDDKTGTITGGYPKNGYGGGVRVDENGSFAMDGGIISGNQTQDYWAGGGVYVDENGTFTMNDGTICNNKAQGGGGVCIRYADFTMNGGTICHNRAHSDQHNNGEGGGISVEGRPDRSASFTMNSGAINNNTADTSGGGVMIYHGSHFTMTDGEINGNTLINQNVQSGGGVYINGEKHAGSTTFTMSGGRICGNSAYEGGGVIVTSYGTFTMTGGVISGNCVTEGYDHQAKGGGVYVCSPTSLDLGGTFNVSGSPVIKGNTKGGDANNIIGTIYNNKINVIGKLTDTAELWVNGAEDNEIAQGLDYTITNGDAEKFLSIDGSCVGVLEDNKVVLKKKTTWTQLLTLLNDASEDQSNPTKIRMNCDATAGESDAGLVVKNNTYVELDLNGHTIDRGLAGKTPVDDGYVIIVGSSASLTVCDSSVSQTGTITGGNNTDSGGGVCMDPSPGVFNLTGGTIKGNKARYGGGVYVWDGDCCISGKARIEGNSCFDMDGYEGLGGGVDVYMGDVSLQDKPVIRNNVRNGTWDSAQGVYTGTLKSNLYLGSGEGGGGGAKKISLNSPLTSGASIGVTLDTLRKFTNNWNSKMGSANPAGYFTSDDSDYTVVLQDGEAALVPHVHSFTYTANGAVITATCSNSDGKCSLPDHKASITIKAPEGDLTYDGTEKAATITGDTAVLGTPEIAYKCGDTPRGDAPKYAENAAYTASVTLEGVTASVSYTIEKKPVTITGLSAENKIYDGDTVAVVKGTASVNGVIDADRGSVSVSPGRAAFTDPNAGTGKTVKFSGWSIDGESAFNYKLSSQPADVTADIEKAVLPDKTVSGNAKYGLTGTLELRPYIADGGRLGTDILVLDDSMILSERPTISGTVLSYGFKSVSENVGKTATVTVSVNEATNYKDYMIKATLEVIDCDHPSRVLTDVKKATCTDKGYTGNYKCTECGGILEYGHETPIDPDNHDYDYSNGKVTKEPTAFTMGEHTYYCRHDHSHTITKQDIAQLPAKDGGDYSDFVNDTKGLSVNSAPPTTDDKGNEVTKITVGGEEVSKITYDPKSGKETIESKVWITGLLKEYTYTGSAIKPEFHVYDGAKRLTEKTDYTVSWAKNKDVGTATITIKFKGNYKDTKSETVTFGIKAAELGKDIIAHEIAIAAKKSGSTKVTPVLTWAKTGKTVSNKYFTVTPDSVKGDVTTTATIMVKGGQNNYSGTTTVNLRAVADKNKMLPNSKVKFDQKSYAYTGRPVTPKYDVAFGSQTLKENVDYKCVSLCNNINPGTATIVFEAVSGNKSGYVGTKTATFKISGKIELKEEGSGSPFTYTVADASGVPYAKGGTKPPVTVRNNTLGTELKEGVDYTLSYSKNKAVTNGNKTAEVKVKGKGNYKGTVILKFAIAKQRLDEDGINIVIKDQFTTKDKLKKPSITVTDIDGKKLKENTDYVISSIDDSVTGNTDTEGVVNVTIKGKGAYNENVPRKVSFRYKSDKSSDISKAKADKIAEQIYTGNQVKLSNEDLKEIVYTGSATAKHYLVPGTDFEITGYTNNIKKGTAKVTIKGKNAYAGTKTLSFKIVQKSVDYKGDLTGGN